MVSAAYRALQQHKNGELMRGAVVGSQVGSADGMLHVFPLQTARRGPVRRPSLFPTALGCVPTRVCSSVSCHRDCSATGVARAERRGRRRCGEQVGAWAKGGLARRVPGEACGPRRRWSRRATSEGAARCGRDM